MRGRRPLPDGEAEDALTRARRFYHWQRGQLRRIKRRVGKRERRYGKAEALRDASAADHPTLLGVRYPPLRYHEGGQVQPHHDPDSVLVYVSPAEVWLECCGAHLVDDGRGIERLALNHYRQAHRTEGGGDSGAHD
mgnify:CR=1 FL=1